MGRPGFKRTYTAQAVVAGILLSIFIGFLVGGAVGLLFSDGVVALIVGSAMCLFSLDIVFNGTEE